ncbi:mCG146069, partial [Mus musculus]
APKAAGGSGGGGRGAEPLVMRGAPGARAAGGSWRCRCCCCCWRETVRASLRRSTGTTAPGQRFSRNSWKPWTPMLPPWVEGTAAAQAGQSAIPARSWRRARAHSAGVSGIQHL